MVSGKKGQEGIQAPLEIWIILAIFVVVAISLIYVLKILLKGRVPFL